MKVLTAYLLFLFLPVNLLAQSGLSGKISASSNVSFTYCKLVLGKDSVSIQTAHTDSTGHFEFVNLADGKYWLHIKVPFKSIDTTVIVQGNTQFDLTIDDGGMLEDVLVVAKQPMIVRKVDRTIFNPADIPALAGGNAADVIEFAPGVYISGDHIKLADGKSVQVMMNDKLIPLDGASLISFIRSIPTEDIQHIEIIPIPPVKYAASVRSGLINIKLVVGSKSRLSKGSVHGEIGQKFYSQQEASGNYAYRKGKFSLYTNASFSNGKSRPKGEKNIDFDTLQWDEYSTSLSQYRDFRGALGMNYELNSSTEIGILGFSSFSSYTYSSLSEIEKRTNSGELFGLIDNRTKDGSDNGKHSLNLSLAKRLDTLGKKLDFNVDYTNYNNRQRINYETGYYNIDQTDSLSSQTNRLSANANFFSGGLDYVHPVKKVTLNFGARYSYTDSRNDLSVFNNLSDPETADTLKSNAFNYLEHIQAGYASVDWKIRKWSFQLGLRGENTMYRGKSPTTGFETANNYFQLVPKVFAMYETKKGNSWNFSYSRSFYRPGYDELNPFRYYTSSFSYRVGNPLLKPSVHHSMSITTSVKDFTMNLYLGYDHKGSTTVTIFDNATQLQQTTYANLYSSRSATLVFSYYKLIKKRISIDAMIIGSFSNTTVSEVIERQNINNFVGILNLDCSFVLDKRESLTLKAYISYVSPSYQNITQNFQYPFTGFSLTQSLLKNRVSLKFSMSDPFRILRFKTITRTNQTVVKDDFYYDTQSVRFSCSFKFGNKRLNVNERSAGSTGEAGRAGKK